MDKVILPHLGLTSMPCFSLGLEYSPGNKASTSGNHSVMWPRVCPGVSKTCIVRPPKSQESPSASATSIPGMRSSSALGPTIVSLYLHQHSRPELVHNTNQCLPYGVIRLAACTPCEDGFWIVMTIFTADRLLGYPCHIMCFTSAFRLAQMRVVLKKMSHLALSS